MANLNGITVGTEVTFKAELVDGIKMLNALFAGVDSDAGGVVVAVSPTTEERLAKYPEVNPHSNADNKVVFYDVTAGRHFMADVDGLEIAGVTLN